MARNIIQNAFNAGEITPELYGRDDTASYRQGCRTLENFIVKPLGGVTRRPGTVYDFATKSATKPTRIFPFSYRDERHMVEVGEDYLRIHEQDVSTGLWTVQQDEGFELPLITAGVAAQHWLTPFFYSTPDSAARSFLLLETTMDRCPLRSFMKVQISTSAGGLPGGLSADTDYWLYVWPTDGTESIFERPITKVGGVGVGFCATLADAQNIGSVGTEDPITVTLTSVGTGTTQHLIKIETTNNEYEFVTLWQDADMPNLRAKQVDDLMYFSDGNNPLYVLRRMDFVAGNRENTPAPDTTWTKPKWILEEAGLWEGPWRKREDQKNADPAQLLDARVAVAPPVGTVGFETILHTRGSAEMPDDWFPEVVTASIVNKDYIFAQSSTTPTDYFSGRLYKTWDGTGSPQTGAYALRPFTSAVSTHVQCDNWAMGFAFMDAGPSAVGWYDERLVLSGGVFKNEVHLSSLEHPWVYLPVDIKSGAISTKTAFSFDIAGDVDNEIVAYSELQDLIIFSGDGVWIANSESGVEGINSTSISVRQIATVGSSSVVDPVRMQQAVAYMSKTNKRLQFIQYNFDAKDYRSFDILEHGEHLLQPVATRMAFQDEPFDILWVDREDGDFVSITLKKEEGVVGGAVHTLGGTAATVEDIITIPAEDNDSDVVYMVVQRTVNSTDAQFVEHITPQVSLGTKYSGTKSDAYHVDCGQTFTGSVANFTMAHLLNETVDVMADGEYLGEITLDGSGASGTLPAAPSGATQPYAKVHAGYTYTSELEPMPPVYDTQGGTTAGSISDIKSATLRMLGSIGGTCGDRADAITDADGHSVLGAINYPDDLDNLFTGDVSVNPEIMTSAQPTVVFRQTKPFPSTVNAIIYRADGTLAADSEGRQTND